MPEKDWFVRRGNGLGWRPARREGWLISAVTLALVIGVLTLLRGSSARVPIAIAIFAVYAIVALATGGARPAPAAAEPDDVVEEPPPPLPSKPLPLRRPSVSTNGEPVLVAEHLTKRFGERTAVSDVSFTVAAGEVFGFLGPNGAGKTTTVRMLATLVPPTSGTAVVAGVPLDPARGTELRQRIAVMPESPGLYLRLTVAENLEFFAGLFGVSDADKRIGEALEAVNLAGRADDLCGSLSKGLRQRVGLARTLLNDPAIVFLDEPTSGLDPVAAREVHDLIDGLRDRGVAVFLTTHRLEEAERICDRVAILNTSLRTIGRPDELRDRYFRKALLVRTAAPLDAPERVFAGAPGVESWRADGPGGYELEVSDGRVAAPAVARALVEAGADLLSLSEERRSLQDVYLELIEEDVEVLS